MNKKEIAEIRKQLTPENCAITEIRGCYVDADRQKVTSFREAFLSLPEEEMMKYSDLLRKTLSGTLQKNLINIEFPPEEEQEGAHQHFLYTLLQNRLEDPELLDRYYDRIIASFPGTEHYLILVVHGSYDIPGRALDHTEMFDASEETYHFLLSCLCPVSLSKPGLSYDAQENCFHNRIRDWIVESPALGFVFPAFNDRQSDIHHLLYYTKNPADLHLDFTDGLFGCALPMTAPSQREVFTALVEETLGETCDFATVKELHQQLRELVEEQKESPEPVALGQNEVKELLAQSGAGQEQMETFDSHYAHVAGERAEFAAANIVSAKTFEVRSPDVRIQISADRTDLIERRFIDGHPCLVIPITEDLTVNGIRVRPTRETE